MNIEDRDYKFTDEQVRALGFSSYEELEKYYDIFYSVMDKGRMWTKPECDSNIAANDLGHRLEWTRRDRLKQAIEDHVGVLLEWDSESWIPTSEEIAEEREAINVILDIYCKFAEKQAKIDLENSELSAPNFGGR